MKTMSANEAKTNFGELLMVSQREPVSVTKNGKPAAVVLSQQEYEALTEEADLAAFQRIVPPHREQEFFEKMERAQKQMLNGEGIAYEGSIRDVMAKFEARRNAVEN